MAKIFVFELLLFKVELKNVFFPYLILVLIIDSRAHNDLARVRHRNWVSSINSDSGAWLSAGLSPKFFVMSNNEFISAASRRNTVEDPMVPRHTPILSREDSSLFQCGCDGGAQAKPIDPFDYHLVGCKVGFYSLKLGWKQ